MAAVLALQTLHDYFDRETAEAVRFDVRWKVACGLAVDDLGFERPRWCTGGGGSRGGAAAPGQQRGPEDRGGDRGAEGPAAPGGGPTILADAVATQDTVTQLVSAIRRVAREVPGAAEQIAAVCTGHDYAAPGKPKIDWDDPAAKDALVSALVNDANAVVAALGCEAGRGGGVGAGAAGAGRRAGRRARRGHRRDRRAVADRRKVAGDA